MEKLTSLEHRVMLNQLGPLETLLTAIEIAVFFGIAADVVVVARVDLGRAQVAEGLLAVGCAFAPFSRLGQGLAFVTDNSLDGFEVIVAVLTDIVVAVLVRIFAAVVPLVAFGYFSANATHNTITAVAFTRSFTECKSVAFIALVHGVGIKHNFFALEARTAANKFAICHSMATGENLKIRMLLFVTKVAFVHFRVEWDAINL